MQAKQSHQSLIASVRLNIASAARLDMRTDYLPFYLWGISIVSILIFAFFRHRKPKALPYSFRPRSCGPGAIGAVYDLLNTDQRHAVEIIVEQRAEERRPEYPDGTMPPNPEPGIAGSKPSSEGSEKPL